MLTEITLLTTEQCLKEAAPYIIPYAFVFVVAFIFYLIGEALKEAEPERSHPAAENFYKLKKFAPTCIFVFKFLMCGGAILCVLVYKGIL